MSLDKAIEQLELSIGLKVTKEKTILADGIKMMSSNPLQFPNARVEVAELRDTAGDKSIVGYLAIESNRSGNVVSAAYYGRTNNKDVVILGYNEPNYETPKGVFPAGRFDGNDCTFFGKPAATRPSTDKPSNANGPLTAAVEYVAIASRSTFRSSYAK